MRAWDERDSFVRRTTRKVKDLEIPEKAAEVGGKVVDFAKETYEKARDIDLKEKYGEIKCSVKRGFNTASEKLQLQKVKVKASDVKDTVVGWFKNGVQKVKDGNPIAIAICAAVSMVVICGIIIAIISALSKKR